MLFAVENVIGAVLQGSLVFSITFDGNGNINGGLSVFVTAPLASKSN